MFYRVAKFCLNAKFHIGFLKSNEGKKKKRLKKCSKSNGFDL
jgi:hypothetical protein